MYHTATIDGGSKDHRLGKGTHFVDTNGNVSSSSNDNLVLRVRPGKRKHFSQRRRRSSVAAAEEQQRDASDDPFGPVTADSHVISDVDSLYWTCYRR